MEQLLFSSPVQQSSGGSSCSSNVNNTTAMQYSSLAADLAGQEKYKDALSAYLAAIRLYEAEAIATTTATTITATTAATAMSPLRHRSSSISSSGRDRRRHRRHRRGSRIVATCNAAGCWRNIGAIHQVMEHYNEAIQCWNRAEDLYRQCKRILLLENDEAEDGESTLSAEPDDDDDDDDDEDDSVAVKSCREHVCLDAMIVETLQSRAHVHELYGHDRDEAVVCHEEVVGMLLRLNESQEWDNLVLRSVPLEGVLFCPITLEKHTELLIVSLEGLGNLYRSVGNTEAGMAAFEDAVDILRDRLEEKENCDKFLNAITHILRTLSNIFFEQGQLDRAIDALHDAVDVVLTRSESMPSEEALEAMDKMGLANEQMGHYEKALACYEKALLVRSRFLGNDNITVAKSLINVARVMELQGNPEGSLDVYQAAQAIYTAKVTAKGFTLEGEDLDAIFHLVPIILEQGRFAEAISYLNKCLEVVEDEGSHEGNKIDKSLLYYDMGQAYMGLNDYVSATVCLLEAAKQEGQVKEKDCHALLQKVERLQRTWSSSASRLSIHSSDWECSETTSSLSVDKSMTGKVLKVKARTDRGRRPDRPTSLHKKSRHSPRDSTPVTSEMVSASESRSEIISLPNDPSHVDEATAYYDSASEAGDDRIPRSDVSSSLALSDYVSDMDSPSLSDGASFDKRRIMHTKSSLRRDSHRKHPGIISSEEDGPASPASDSYEGAGRVKLMKIPSPARSKVDSQGSKASSKVSLKEKFRMGRRDGFQSLPEEKHEQQESPDTSENIPSEEDYHSAFDFNGPIQFVAVPSKSWDSGISQITLRFENPDSQRDGGQEWWWNVTAEGFGRWFPSSYVSQAVQAAEGFLSAKAIHSQVKEAVEAPLDFAAEVESEEESESEEIRDHPSYVGITDSIAAIRSERATHGVKATETDDQLGEDPGFKCDEILGTLMKRHRHPVESTSMEADLLKCEQKLSKEKATLGPDHPRVATTLFTLAVLHSRQRGSKESVDLAIEALRIQKAAGNLDEAARSLHFLGDLYLHQKQYKSSLLYYSEALRLQKSQFGYYNEETAKTLNCIGTVRSLQNEYGLAMESHHEALQILKECHGEDLKHPLVSQTLCHIGSVYYRERNSLSVIKGKSGDYTTFIEGGMLEVIGRAHEDRGAYKMAISFFEEKLQFLENEDDQEDKLEDAASTLNSLGMLCTRAGLFVESIDYYERALSIQLKLGCDEIYLATARVLTASVQFQLGYWKKAITLLQDALLTLEEHLGQDHETVAAALFQTGLVQVALCEDDRAMSSFRRALEIQTKTLGNDHPATLRTRREIGNMYAVYQDELDSAFEEFNRVLSVQLLIHGTSHPNLAETLHSIGAALARKGAHSKALQVLEECYYMRGEFLGWDHPLQATTLHEIAKIHMDKGRCKKAVEICDLVIRIRREALNDRHIDVAMAMNTKGSCLVKMGKGVEAMKCLSEALKIAENAVGATHPLVAKISVEIAMQMLRNCQFGEARGKVKKAIEVYRWSNLDDDHPDLMDAFEKLAKVERDEMLCV